jgi:hypothetical protein
MTTAPIRSQSARSQPAHSIPVTLLPILEGIARGRRFVLSDLTPAAIRARGGEAGREAERAYADLRAVHTAREAAEPPASRAKP